MQVGALGIWNRARWDSCENEILHLEFCLRCIKKCNSSLETFRQKTFLIFDFKFGRKYKKLFCKMFVKFKFTSEAKFFHFLKNLTMFQSGSPEYWCM